MFTLKISEIFFSLQGETSRMGLPTAFIRLSGCPARCSWCDTEYAFAGGKVLSVDSILEKIKSYKARFATLTGGEPLAQKNSLELLKALCDAGFAVNLETGGMLDISKVDERVSVTLDIKPPASGEHENNLWSNLSLIRDKDEIKFVIASRDDYDWVKSVLDKYKLADNNVLLSPATGLINPTDLAEWILEDKLKVRFQLQLHKLLWQGQKAR